MNYNANDVIIALNAGLITEDEAKEYMKAVFEFRWASAGDAT